jgi:hypothetical protein
MRLPEDYWSSFGHTITSFAEYIDAVRIVSAYQAATGTRFVWRGVVDADWGFHSSLAREYRHRFGVLPTEKQLATLEGEIVAEARDWSLDWHSGGGRLAGLELLAALQHYGAPTRLLDFTFNPLIALWFAAEQKDATPGRIVAIDISDRIVDRALASLPDPWWFGDPPDDWSTRSWVWRPPPFEQRIVRQDGCFLIGGIPSKTPTRNVREGNRWRVLRTPQVRECMSVPFGLVQYAHATAAASGEKPPGRPPSATRAFTLRITGKPTLRADLDRTFGYSHATIFPDFPGFAARATDPPA